MPDGITFPTLTRLVHDDAPRPADYAATSEAESEIRAQEIHRRRRAAVSEAEQIIEAELRAEGSRT